MKMLPPPPPYVLPLGGAVYWLAGGPLLSSSAPPQHNILQLVLSAPLNKPYSQKRSVFDESPETIFNAQILNRQCRNKIKSNKKKKKKWGGLCHFFVRRVPKSQERVSISIWFWTEVMNIINKKKKSTFCSSRIDTRTI